MVLFNIPIWRSAEKILADFFATNLGFMERFYDKPFATNDRQLIANSSRCAIAAQKPPGFSLCYSVRHEIQNKTKTVLPEAILNNSDKVKNSVLKNRIKGHLILLSSS